MNVWEMTLEDFLTKDCEKTGDTSASLEMFISPPLLVEPGWYEGKEIGLKTHPAFATAALKRAGMSETLAFQALLEKHGDGWRIVGVYIDDTIILAEPFRGRGLATELVLRCLPYRSAPARRTVSPAGLRTLTKAYYLGVGRAIEEGRDVPAHIRADYEKWRA